MRILPLSPQRVERISTSSADSTCKFPGYFRAASARILENTIADERIAEEWFLLTSAYTYVGSWFNKWLRATAISRWEREREMRKWVTDFSRNRSLSSIQIRRRAFTWRKRIPACPRYASSRSAFGDISSCYHEGNIPETYIRKYWCT